MADNLKCNHEWTKYEPGSMVFLPKIPESECCEMVMLYSPAPMYVYVYLNNCVSEIPMQHSVELITFMTSDSVVFHSNLCNFVLLCGHTHDIHAFNKHIKLESPLQG